MSSKFKESEKFTMSRDALRNVECPEREESYTDKKAGASEMFEVRNGIEYNREGKSLHRVNDGFSVRLHFQETESNSVNAMMNFLKEQYIAEICKKQVGE